MERVDLVDETGRRWRTDVARTRSERMRGLITSEEPAADTALLLPRAGTIHTFGMGYAISVAWLAGDGRVIDVRRLPPRRLALRRPGARHVLECADGAAPRMGTRLSRR